MFMCLHVDDGYLVSNSDEMIDVFMSELLGKIKSATLYRPCQKYLGIEIEQSGDHMILNQNAFIEQMDMLGIGKEFKKTTIPLSNTVDLGDQEKNPPNPEIESLLPATGSFRYVADRTRVDILQAVGAVSSNATPHPSDAHLEGAKRIMRYLKSTPNMKLRLGGKGPKQLFGFSDANHYCKGKALSRLGGALFDSLDSGAISCICKKSATVSLSSCEDEIKAITLMCCLIIHARDIYAELGFRQDEPTVLYVDSESSMDLIKTLKSKEATRHINTRINFIRECVNNRIIELVFIKSEFNVADMFTKALGDPLFFDHSDKVMNGFKGDIRNISTIFKSFKEVKEEVRESEQKKKKKDLSKREADLKKILHSRLDEQKKEARKVRFAESKE
jgi:hypothetical protein